MTTQRGSAVRRPIAVGIAVGAAGAALALGALWASGEFTSPANAQDPPTAGQGGFTLSVGQLRINQRISQAAVRRSNESLTLLDPIRPLTNQPTKVLGWKTANLADAAVTGPKIANGAVGTNQIDTAAVTTGKIAGAAVTGAQLAPGSVGSANLTTELANQLPMWALVNPAGGLVRQRGATNAQNLAAGVYRVTFGRDVSQCSYTATQNAFFGMIGTVNDAGNVNAVLVATSNAAGAATNRAFTLHVLC
jgi:hypothetical protein